MKDPAPPDLGEACALGISGSPFGMTFPTKALIFAIAASASTDATACLFRFQTLFETFCPFEGLELPRTAELRVGAEGSATLTRPEGTRVDVEAAAIDGQGPRLATGVLEPGPHVLSVLADDLDTAPREIEFSIGEDSDDQATPAPLVTARHHIEGEIFSADGCGSETWPFDVVDLSIETDEPLAPVTAGGPSVAVLSNGAGVIERSLSEERGGDVEFSVVVRDFAGNESEPTIVTAWAGCASSADLPVSAALLLMLSRRRRRSGVITP